MGWKVWVFPKNKGQKKTTSAPPLYLVQLAVKYPNCASQHPRSAR